MGRGREGYVGGLAPSKSSLLLAPFALSRQKGNTIPQQPAARSGTGRMIESSASSVGECQRATRWHPPRFHLESSETNSNKRTLEQEGRSNRERTPPARPLDSLRRRLSRPAGEKILSPERCAALFGRAEAVNFYNWAGALCLVPASLCAWLLPRSKPPLTVDCAFPACVLPSPPTRTFLSANWDCALDVSSCIPSTALWQCSVSPTFHLIFPSHQLLSSQLFRGSLFLPAGT
jgi:hypothetical protein